MVRIVPLFMISVWPWLPLSQARAEPTGEAGTPAETAPSGSHREEPAPSRKSTLEIPRAPIAGIPFHDAVAIYQRYRKELEQMPGVSAVGLTTEGIFVSTTTPSNLPAQVEGIPITVVPADHPGINCGPEAHWHATVGRCRRNVPLDARQVGRQPLPPPPGVIILRPGGKREQAEACPRGFEEQDYAGWRFCLDPDLQERIPPPLWKPPVAGIPYEEALKILERHRDELGRLPGVTSTGLSEEGIVVETNNPSAVPSQVEGLPIITRPSGPAPHLLNHTTTQPIRPLHGAVLTRDNLHTTAGTLTGVVLSEGKPWLVLPTHLLFRCNESSNCPPPSGFPPPPGSSVLNSCSHYVGYGTGGSALYTLYQPVQGSIDIVGFIQRWDPTPGTSNPAGTITRSSDVAAAFLDNNTTEGDGSLAVDRRLEEWGTFAGVVGAPSAENGQNQVHFVTADPYGSGFHVLPARVYDTDRDIVVTKGSCPGGFYQTLYAQTFLEATDFCFLPGDSGSPVIDGQGRIVGMVNWAYKPPGNPCFGGGTNAHTIQNVLGFDHWYGTAANDSSFGTFRPSQGRWYLDNGNGQWQSNTPGEWQIHYGTNGDRALSGSWNGGNRCVGVYRPSQGRFYLDSNCDGVTDTTITMGLAEDIPIAGDWNNDGKTDVGLWRPSTKTFYLDFNGNKVWEGCGVDKCFTYGLSTDKPVAGNWGGSPGNAAKTGVYRPSEGKWYLEKDNNGWQTGQEIVVGPFGLSDDKLVIGNWTGVGTKDKIGVFHTTGGGIVPPATWVLDNGDGAFTSYQREQRLGPFGLAEDQPVAWRKTVWKAN